MFVRPQAVETPLQRFFRLCVDTGCRLIENKDPRIASMTGK
jgi:hypothetical protein